MELNTNSIAAIIVTFNRKALLKEAIDALLVTHTKLDEIIVVDNCSTDGTDVLLREYSDKITPIFLKENVGGAGGFNAGLKYAYEKKHTLFWVMDDDTIVEIDALDKLMNKYNLLDKENVGFLCSNVLWTDKTPCIMNKPDIAEDFNEKLAEGIVKVKSCSFVSILITRNAIKQCGYPIKEFFIWMDDTEFTLRVNKKFNNYLVPDSIVIHKMGANVGTNFINDNTRLERYFYDFRNRFYLAKKQGVKFIIKYYINLIRVIFGIISKSEENKIKKIKIALHGAFKGILFNPKIEDAKN
ncbi:MAG: glycosyltransferase family 2 protein [Clostridium sp.]|nr:glycosyltransferase family 2 protein [Clostridium sp.]